MVVLWRHSRMWEPKFTSSITIIGGKLGNPNFSWGPGFCARTNDKWPNKCGKYEKITKQIYGESISLFRICVRALRLLQEIIKASAARAVSEFPSSSHQQQTKKIKIKVLIDFDWTLWKAAYVPLSKIKPDVVQLKEWNKKSNWLGEVV